MNNKYIQQKILSFLIYILLLAYLSPTEAFASRTITSATLNSNSSVTVNSSASITAVVNVTTDTGGGNKKWQSTSWSIGGGSYLCINHADYTASGSYSESLTITAPVTSGTYSASFIAYSDDSCTQGASSTYTMTNAVTVKPPIADYRMDECSWNGVAGEVKDSGPSGLHAIAINGATIDTGKVCKSGKFDGTNDYVDVGNVLNPLSSSWSVSVWFKWNGKAGDNIIYNKENLYEAKVSGGYFQYAWMPHWNWDGGTSFPVTQDTWYHAVVTYDGITQKVYKDGIKVYERAQSGAIGTNTNKLLMGARGSGSPGSFFGGNIDEVQMFDMALTAEDITNLYSNEATGKNYNGTERVCSNCVSNINVIEGDSGTTNALFTLALGKPVSSLTTIDYATADGTATVADNDYNETHGTIFFAAGEQTKTVTVTINGDLTFEQDETFKLILSNPTNGLSINSEVIGTIINDDIHFAADYHLDECVWNGIAGEVKDSGPSGLHAIAINGATIDTGKVCKSGKFDGTNDYVDVGNVLNPLSSSWSVSVWFKWNGKAGDNIIYNKENLYEARVSGGYFQYAWQPHWNWDGDTSFPVTQDTWYHAVVTYDGITQKVYKDGEKVYERAQSGAIGTNTNKLLMGARGSGSPGSFFGGNIDEVQMFDMALTAEKVKSLYNNEVAEKNYDGSGRTCSSCLIADYRLEELSWNGTVGEVKDSCGNNLNGTTIGTPKPTPITTLPARVGNPGTCGYGSFPGPTANGGAINIDNLPVSAATGAKTTVSFWMKWNGTNSIMPIGWNIHDLWLKGGYFGFNTGNGDVFGIASTGLANRWAHVVAIFTNGSVTTNALYIDGVKQTLTQRLSTPTNANAKVQSTLRISGWQHDTNYRFSDSIDEVKIFTSALTQSQVNTLYTETHPCGSTLPSPVYTFDAWDSFRSFSDRNISTKIVNKPFILTIASLNETNNGFQDFNGTVCAQILNNTNQNISGWNKPPFTDRNTTTTAFTINQAIGGSDSAKLKISWKKNVDSTCPITGEDNSTIASDRFAIRPISFDLNTSNAVAGVDFNITFTAPNFSGTPSSDYNETAGNSFTVTTAEHNASCLNGTFNPDPNSAWNFVNGAKTFTTRYNEVGMVDINISDFSKPCPSRYTKIDCDDANVSDGTNFTADLLPIGLTQKSITIKPDHFDLNATLSNAVTGFTYLSTDLNMSAQLDLNITAKTADGNTTKNYNTGCYAKQTDYTISYTAPSITPSTNLTKLNYLETNTSTSGNVATTANAFTLTALPKTIFGSDTNGSAKLSVKINFDRSNSLPVNPFDLNITSAVATDTDSVTGNDTMVGNASFVYGRTHAYDVTTNQTSNVPNPIEIEVYGKNSSHLFLNNKFQNVLYWYRNTDHNNALAGSILSGNAYDTNVTVTTNNPPLNGIQSILLSYSKTIPITRTVHLTIPAWLWYSPAGKTYISTGTDCTTHPCFNYNYTDTSISSVKGVSSGTFGGTDFTMTPANNIIKKGVKVFR